MWLKALSLCKQLHKIQDATIYKKECLFFENNILQSKIN